MITKFDAEQIKTIDTIKLKDFIGYNKIEYNFNEKDENLTNIHTALVYCADNFNIGIQGIIDRLRKYCFSWQYFEPMLKKIQTKDILSYFKQQKQLRKTRGLDDCYTITYPYHSTCSTVNRLKADGSDNDSFFKGMWSALGGIGSQDSYREDYFIHILIGISKLDSTQGYR